MPKLILFDANFTLLDIENGFALRPGVKETIARLKAQPPPPAMAIVTNQCEPACHAAGWEWSARYPDLAIIETRYDALTTDLGLSVVSV